MIWSSVWPFVLFVVGIVVVIWATERLLEGLIGLAGLLRVSAFAVAAVLSGFEAENVAVGLAAARREAAELALGTVFGGAIFLVCVALGLGTLLYPLRVTLPGGFLFLMAVCPMLVGVGLIGGRRATWLGWCCSLPSSLPSFIWFARLGTTPSWNPKRSRRLRRSRAPTLRRSGLRSWG